MKQISLHILILATAIASLILTACDKDDIGPDSGNVAPVFTATIKGGQSRVNGCNWEPGDEIGITCSTAGATNYCYVTSDGNGRFTAKDVSNHIVLKSSTTGTTSWTFYAYYPWTETSGSFSVNTSDQTKQQSFDFLFASAKATKDSPNVDLEFSHKMSKVTFVFKNGHGFNVSDIESYSLGDLYLNGTFNISTGGCTASTSGTANKASTVTMDLKAVNVKDGEPAPPLILFPQTVPGKEGVVNLKIYSSDGSVYAVGLTFPSNKLIANNNYIFTITVNKSSLTVNECTIEDWNNYWPEGSSGEGTADSADDPEE